MRRAAPWMTGLKWVRIGRNEMTSMQDKLVIGDGRRARAGRGDRGGLRARGARLIVADLARRWRLPAHRPSAMPRPRRRSHAGRHRRRCGARFRRRLRGAPRQSTCWSTTPASPARAAFDDPQTPEIWDRLMGVNLQGAFVTHAFVEQLGPRAASSTCAPSPPMAAASRPPATWCPRAACAPSPKCWRATWRRMACGSTPSRPGLMETT